MKKSLTMLTALFLLAGCAIGSTVDLKESTDENDNVPKVQLDLESSEKESDNTPEPPFVLEFRGLDDINRLREVSGKGEDTLRIHLDENNYSMNGLRTKKDVDRLLLSIHETYIPLLHQVMPPTFIVYPEWNQLRILHEKDDGCVFSFTIFMERDSANEYFDALMRDNLIDGEPLSSKSVEKIYSIKPNVDDDAISLVLEVNGTYVLARVFNVGTAVRAIASIEDFEFIKIGNHMNLDAS